jgi:hypothetical protein
MLALTLLSSCLSLPSARITGLNHHTWHYGIVDQFLISSCCEDFAPSCYIRQGLVIEKILHLDS